MAPKSYVKLNYCFFLALVEEENKPRYQNIDMYLQIIGLDFEEVIKKLTQYLKFGIKIDK